MRKSALITAAAVAGLAVPMAWPGVAHAAVSGRADASALDVKIAGQGTDSGRVQATWDGQESVTGSAEPQLALPVASRFVNLGVLTQQATAGDGTAAACAGVAGNGGGTIQIGDGSCLTPGETVRGSLTDLTLGNLLDLDAGELEAILAGTPADRVPELPTDPIDDVISRVTEGIAAEAGDLGLGLRFDVIEGRCAVTGNDAGGSASIVNAALVATGIEGRDPIQLVQLPANPPPNTEVATDLSQVVDVLLAGVDTQLRDGLQGALSPLAEGVLGPVREQLVAGIRDNLEEQLEPLEANLVRVVLNEQSRPTSDSVRVTALRAEVLPVAREQLGASVVDVKIGDVGCGPADAAPAAAPQEPALEKAGPAPARPALPTAVSAGIAGEDAAASAAPYAVLGLGGLAISVAGVAAIRRRLTD